MAVRAGRRAVAWATALLLLVGSLVVAQQPAFAKSNHKKGNETGNQSGDQTNDPITVTGDTSSSVLSVCHNQIYALCATASCFVFNDVAYCTCDIKKGTSISESYAFGSHQNVCTVNAQGPLNGYMVSLYSLPTSVLAPDGNQAVYTCPGETASGAYAQCDGAFCYTSSAAQQFPPGSHEQLRPDQIVCTCPITVSSPPATSGYQIIGPYPCKKSFFKYCNSKVASTDTAAKIYSGAPTGAAAALTTALYGSVPPFNTCSPPDDTTSSTEP